MQLPLRPADAESGPAYVTGAVHEAMPEKELPLKETVTGWLYQPFESGGRALAAISRGRDLDVKRVRERLVVAAAQVTPHDTVSGVDQLRTP